MTQKGVSMKNIIIYLVLFSCVLTADQDIQDNETIKQEKPSKLERTEQRADYMEKKIEYYNSVVESVKQEEEELKKLKKQSLYDIKKNKN